ncbi:NACHT domain-containing protein [Almyronema epifaneia]|uniref:NACHT domain-containing protein n=1 Tax=Almyronema epifaneia S1 TaxID=2991925 RepID=A0ABW6IEL9_9CYAN
MTGNQPNSGSPWLEEAKKLLNQTLVAWGVPGAVGLLAVHFAREKEWWAAIACLLAAGLLWLLIRFFSQLTPSLDKLFQWLALKLETAAIAFWWTLSANFKQQYYQRLIYTYRNYRTQGLKTTGPFTLDLEKTFVPLGVAPESLNRAATAMIRQEIAAKSFSIWDFLARMTGEPGFRHLGIIGPPGSGKTTLLEFIALTYAQNTYRQQNRNAPRLVPVVIYLRQVWEEIVTGDRPTLVDLIQQQFQHQDSLRGLNPPPNWFATQLRRGTCLVMLDGLDEIAEAAYRRQISAWVNQQIRTHPQTPFIVTSRPFGYRAAPVEEVKTLLQVKPFTLSQIEQFIQSWYRQNEIRAQGRDDLGVQRDAASKAKNLMERIKLTPAIAAMATNPLLLTMIATVHNYRGALPGRRVELYGEICDVLLGRRQEAKGMPDRLTAAQKQAVLQKIALNRMTKKTLTFKTVTGMILIREKLDTVTGGTLEPDVFLKQIENVSGLLVEKEDGVYQFAHKSLQEYLAAVEIKERQQEYILTRTIDDPWWAETVRLYAAQNDASNLIWAALQRRDSENAVQALTLAYECLAEGLSVQADMRQELETVLERGLESTEPGVFKLAAEVKLAQRLKNLLRLDETTEIDTRLLTCAEYQLFIDEMKLVGEDRQPPHWPSDRFQPGEANQPIWGVRDSDAAEFCEWLTQRSNAIGDKFIEQDAAVFVGHSKIRLPHAIEIEKHPVVLPKTSNEAQLKQQSIRIVREQVNEY